MAKAARIRKLMVRTVLGTVLATALGAQAAPSAPAKAPATAPKSAAKRPNIVVILADDMGFSDISAYGSEIPTPNIDALAQGGLKFSQFYNTARCSCSRASLLTGLYPHEAGLGYLEEKVVPGSPGVQGKLLDRAVTLGEVLKSAGYFTAIAGKWHVGITHGVGPWQRGFDRSITPLMGGLYYPDQTTENQKMVFIDGKQVPANSSLVSDKYWYASDMWVDWQTKFFHQAEAEKKPFFLYMPFTAVHFPLMAPPETIAKFKGKYMAGWDALRKARFERQKKMGLIPQNAVLPARLAPTYDWDKLSPAEKDRFDTIMAIYAADLERMDMAVGTLVARLKAAGEYDNTLILFLSDNGGNAESGPEGRAKSTGGPLGSAHSVVFAGMNWATLQNTPLQYFKHYTEEGGIATPLIMHWTNGIDPKASGQWNRTPGHLIDIMPTLAEVAGATYPTTYKGHKILPEEGRSMVPAFHGQPLVRNTPIYWEHEGNRAIRDGDWKMVSRFGFPWQLFDMSQGDRSETHDLAATNPAIVQKLSGEWDAWAKRSYVGDWRSEHKFGDGGADKLPNQNKGGGKGKKGQKPAEDEA